MLVRHLQLFFDEPDNGISLKHTTEIFKLLKPGNEASIVAWSRYVEKYCESQDEEVELIDLYGHEFYSNWQHGKSKLGRGAYPQDIRRRDLLGKILDENDFNLGVKLFLQRCKAQAEKNIKDEIEEEENNYAW